jgi:hypothetical protein
MESEGAALATHDRSGELMTTTSSLRAHTRRAGVLAATATVALGLAACGGGAANSASSTTPATTSATASAASPTTSQAAPTQTDPLVADQALVRSLYYAYSRSSDGTLADEAAFVATHNYPQFRYTAAECEAASRSASITDSDTWSAVPDVTAMAIDKGWALSPKSGRYAGMIPTGRAYIVPLQWSESDPSTGLNDSSPHQVHVAIVNGTAYFFVSCEKS